MHETFGRVVPKIADRQTQTTRSTQPCIPPRSLNRVPAAAGGKGGNVTSAGWQVTLCDPMWHVSSRSCVATLRTAIHFLLTYLLTYTERSTDRHAHYNTPLSYIAGEVMILAHELYESSQPREQYDTMRDAILTCARKPT